MMHRLLNLLTGRRESGPTAMIGVGVSLFLHMALALSVALLVVGTRVGGDGPDGWAPDVSVASQTELSALRAEMGGGEPLVEETTRALPSPDGTLPADPLPSLSAGEAGALGSGSGAKSVAPAEGADGLAGMGAGDGSAKFFGLEARGSRFAYVVDVSGSMSGARLKALQDELVRSISALGSSASFTIVSFSSTATMVSGKTWVKAAEAQRRSAMTEVLGMKAEGGTMPVPAMEAVLAMRPRPDNVYLMTDGEFDANSISQLMSMLGEANKKNAMGTRVHCIAFGEKRAEGFMRRIARLTGGTYVYVEGPKSP